MSNGNFVWYELMTTDVAAAKTFYTGLIGWGTQSMEGPMDYTMWTVGDNPVAGMMDLPEEARKMGAPPHWLGYVSSDDLDASLAQVSALGGNVLVPVTEIPGSGRFAVFADPSGGVLGLYHSAADAGPDTGPSADPGLISWHEHMAPDLDKAWEFYEKLFGWKKTEAMDMGEFGLYQMYGKNEHTYGGMMKKPAEMPGPATWAYYINVADMDGAVEKVKATGGTVMNGPMEVPGGSRVAQCTDPQGAVFALHGK